MSFSWPLVLVALVIVPLAVAIYIWLQHRKRKYAVRYASLSLIREAVPRRSRWRRHIPFALFLLSLASLVFAASRPQSVVAVPKNRTSIILAMDVSLSMCSTDVLPNRLTVAQDVARRFVRDQPGGTRIGLVVFAGYAQLAVPPTTEKKQLLAAIDAFQAGRGTAVGTAVLKSVDAIAEVNPNVTRSGVDLNAVPGSTPPEERGDDYEADIIVLLTDGATTQGVNPLVAARQAADRRVRVYTIGFGTDDPAVLSCNREQLGSGAFGGPFGGGQGPGGPGTGGGNLRRRPLIMDDKTLSEIADITGGRYYTASDSAQLQKVFKDLPSDVTIQKEEQEVSFAFAGFGALAAVVAVGLSLAWNRYP